MCNRPYKKILSLCIKAVTVPYSLLSWCELLRVVVTTANKIINECFYYLPNVFSSCPHCPHTFGFSKNSKNKSSINCHCLCKKKLVVKSKGPGGLYGHLVGLGEA
jgi:hypothetical protein